MPGVLLGIHHSRVGAQHIMASSLPLQLPPAAGNRAASTCWRWPSCPPSSSPPSVPASAPSMPGPAGPPKAGLPVPAWPRRPAVPGQDDVVSHGVLTGGGTPFLMGWGQCGARTMSFLVCLQSCTPMPRPWWISCAGLVTSSETSLTSPSSPTPCPSSWARSMGTSSHPAFAGMPQVHPRWITPCPLRVPSVTPMPTACSGTPTWLAHPLSHLFPSCPHRPGCGRGPAQAHSKGSPETPLQVRHGGLWEKVGS